MGSKEIENKVRRRHKNSSESKISDKPKKSNLESLSQPKEREVVKEFDNVIKSGTYWLTRIVFLRSLGFIYAVAFLVAANQNKQLIGSKGLLPADKYLEKVSEQGLSSTLLVPTLLWLIDPKNLDFYLDIFAYFGLAISLAILLTGSANALAMFTLWVLYHSFVNIGQTWYSFGWESQLLETGFLAIFFCPALSWEQMPRNTPPSWVVIWGYRWLLFRIMLGAGLIKLRGDSCWFDLTCMDYHYETQPVPNPLSFFLHQTPRIVHRFETFSNHLIELFIPWCLFAGRPFRLVCGLIQIAFQCVLILSGNLSFLNWLTILPAIPYFDDKALAPIFAVKNSAARRKLVLLQAEESRGEIETPRSRRITNISLALAITYLSIPVVINLASSSQMMNTSFEPLRIVNTYGAFGSVTKVRMEVILQGTYSNDPNDPAANWFEYEFKCKPGNVTRRPCVISPYHYRLDWLMWFAAFQEYQQNPWIIHLVAKLLVNDPIATDLIAHNPFKGKKPPKFIRAEHYLYKFAPANSERAKRGHWWVRKRIANYMQPYSIGKIEPVIQKFGWVVNKKTKKG